MHSVGIVYSYQIAPLIEQDWIRVDGTGGHKKLRANLNVSSPPVVGKKETAKKSSSYEDNLSEDEDEEDFDEDM